MSDVRDNLESVFPGKTEMARRMRELDWSRTPLGPVERWPRSLLTSVSTCLDCAFPIVLWWGPELTILYNDEYRPMLGPEKHPAALGMPGAKVWAEIWPIIRPMLSQVMERGEATRSRDLMLHIDRGYLEEAYFSFSYSPIHDEERKIGGVFCPVIETTQQVIGERRLRTLRDLAAKLQGSRSETAVYESAMEALGANPHDVPFAMIYRVDADRSTASLEAAAGIEPGAPAAPRGVALAAGEGCPWSLGTVAVSGKGLLVNELWRHFASLPCGAWEVPPQGALVLPVLLPGHERPRAILVAAVSPMRALDTDHRTFFELVATQLAAGLADAQAIAEERRRAEALAEIDRAKTAFFSNVSHELRTPLTLLLGPTEELLSLKHGSLPAEASEEVEVIHRNALRLQKLVNTLLDFSRIEAGRVQAAFVATDLAAFTGELASAFRSAALRAGLRLIVDCESLAEPVYVDHDMWEKIVLNLISNALKFTFDGEIEVKLRDAGERVALSVRDTGTGIAKDELPRLFERFHRIKGARARTHEGTGIGLALVAELVKLHGGTIEVESTPGKGATFTVTLWKGKAHLPAERVEGSRPLASTALGASPFVEEALRWLPGKDRRGEKAAAATSSEAARERSASGCRARVLWADDNADMRGYVSRLLGAAYEVEAVPDGEAALAAARRELPDLVLADVMMPHLDGIELLRALRADERTRTIPVILLSARAGEEARVDGLEAGADDYIVKPFQARELLARIDAHVRLAAVRRQSEAAVRASEQRVLSVLESIGEGFLVIDPQWRLSFLNAAARRMLGSQGLEPDALIGNRCLDVLPAFRGTALEQQLAKAMTERVPVELEALHEPWQRWYAIRAFPIEGGGISIYFHDITGNRRAEALLAEQKQLLELILAGHPGGECFDALAAAASRLLPEARAGVLLESSAAEDRFDVHLSPSLAGERDREAIRDMAIGACADAIRTCRPTSTSVLAGDSELAGSWAARCREHGVLACHATPVLAPDGTAVAAFFLCFATARQPTEWKLRLAQFGAHIAGIVLERDRLSEAFAENKAWLDGQQAALELAVSGAAVEEVLHRLAATVRELAGAEARTALFVVDGRGNRLRLAACAGMSDAFQRSRDGLEIGPGAPAAGCAAHTGRSVIVEDVMADARWGPHLALARDHGIRACWSFPILSVGGKVLGVLELYHRSPREPRRREPEMIHLFGQTAALVIEQHNLMEERHRALSALRRSEAQLEAELSDTKLLQRVSAQLIHEEKVELVHENILNAALDVLRADFGHMQALFRDRGEHGELRLLAQRGFPCETAEAWKRLRADRECACSESLRTGKRTVIHDIETCSSLSSPAVLEYRRLGIRAAQTTPLVSRSGKLLGMISAHWCEPHQPSERDLRLLDILARQAADLIERKQGQDQLRRNHDTFFLLVENAPFGVCVVDAQLRVRQVSTGSQKLFANVRPLIGRDFAEVLRFVWHEPFASDMIARIHHSLKTGQSHAAPNAIQKRRDIPETQSYDWRIEQIRLPDGRYGVVCYFYDMTEPRLAEEAVRLRTAQYETLLNQAPLGVYLVDADLRLREVNPVARPLFGDIPDLIGRDFDEVIHTIWRQEYADELVRIFRRTLETGERHVTLERIEERRDRAVKEYHEWRTDRIPMPDGRYGVVCYFRDISTHVLARQALSDSQEALREADRRKEKFLAMLAHELRNPLGAIRNAARVMKLIGAREPNLQWSTDVIDRQVAHLARIVDDLVEVSRIARGEIVIRKEPMELSTSVVSAVEANQELADARRQTLTVDTAPVELEADPARLTQIISNILHNAIKYTAEGGRIEVSAREEDGAARIGVKDSGGGISAELLPRIFDPFVQGERPIDGPPGGLGLGLAIVKSLVELHGGTIRIASEVGKGTEVVIRIPAASRLDLRSRPRQTRARPAPLGPRRVLIVDDNVDGAESTALLLKTLGHEIRLAFDGSSALQAAAELLPEIVLLDMGLPGMHGYEVARRLRELPGCEHAMLVAMTGYGQESDKQQAYEAGINLHLTKPLSFDSVEMLFEAP